MKSKMIFCLFLAMSFVVASVGQTSGQVVLWDQQPIDSLPGSIVDQQIPDQPQLSSYVVNDVNLNFQGTGVLVDSIDVYFSNINETWAGVVNQAVLNIFDGDPLTSSDDPSSGGDFGGIVDIDVTVESNHLVITASNLDLFLDLSLIHI